MHIQDLVHVMLEWATLSDIFCGDGGKNDGIMHMFMFYNTCKTAERLNIHPSFFKNT